MVYMGELRRELAFPRAVLNYVSRARTWIQLMERETQGHSNHTDSA